MSGHYGQSHHSLMLEELKLRIAERNARAQENQTVTNQTSQMVTSQTANDSPSIGGGQKRASPNYPIAPPRCPPLPPSKPQGKAPASPPAWVKSFKNQTVTNQTSQTVTSQTANDSPSIGEGQKQASPNYPIAPPRCPPLPPSKPQGKAPASPPAWVKSFKGDLVNSQSNADVMRKQISTLLNDLELQRKKQKKMEDDFKSTLETIKKEKEDALKQLKFFQATINQLMDDNRLAQQQLETNKKLYLRSIKKVTVELENFKKTISKKMTEMNTFQKIQHDLTLRKVEECEIENTETEKMSRSAQGPSDSTSPTCAKCATTATSRWRKNDEGERVCNTCGVSDWRQRKKEQVKKAKQEGEVNEDEEEESN
jgi:hypothetical protein